MSTAFAPRCSATKEELLRDYAGSKVGDPCPLCVMVAGAEEGEAGKVAPIGLHPASPTAAGSPASPVPPAYVPLQPQQPLSPSAIAIAVPLDVALGRTGRKDYPSGKYYLGELNAAGEPHGTGVVHHADGRPCAGDLWADGLQSGHGFFSWASGAHYIGAWANGMRDGQGTYRSANGDLYVGGWKLDMLHGFVEQTAADGTVKYKGHMWNNKPVGGAPQAASSPSRAAPAAGPAAVVMAAGPCAVNGHSFRKRWTTCAYVWCLCGGFCFPARCVCCDMRKRVCRVCGHRSD